MITFTDLKNIVSELSCEPYKLHVGVFSSTDRWYIQARLWRKSVDNGEYGWGSGGKYYVSPHSTPEEIRQKCLAACLAYAEHEVRENFLWNGRAIFGPHLDHDLLWEAANPNLKVRRPTKIGRSTETKI